MVSMEASGDNSHGNGCELRSMIFYKLELKAKGRVMSAASKIKKYIYSLYKPPLIFL